MASDANNIVVLNCTLIPRANDILRSLFRTLWQKSTGNSWENKPEAGQHFISSLGKSTWISATCRQKELIESGNVWLWDLKLLNHVLQKLEAKDDDKLKIRVLSDAYDAVTRENTLTEAKFNLIQATTEELALNLTDLAEKVEKLSLVDADEAILNAALARDFKHAGKQFLKQKQHRNAINSYTEAIKLPKLTKKDLGELYADRCELYLAEPVNMADLMVFKGRGSQKSALEDAKRAVQLCPKMIKAYLGLARAYFALNKHAKALNRIDFASQLGKLPLDVVEIREKCRQMVEMTKSAPIDREKYPQNEEELRNEFNRTGMSGMTLEMFQRMEKLFKDGAEPSVTVWQAHRCMLGFDRDKNCELGIELYTKAAKEGNAEAKYNLGVIYREGGVVERDFKKSVELLEEAANSVCKRGLVSAGVSEAQFELGIMRLKAKGISRDYEKAIYWLAKSSENGNKMAAHVLGSFYLKGNCVEKDEAKAIQFWKLAAQRCDVISMQCLAEYYLTCAVDPDKALEWHRRALESGFIRDDVSKAFISMVEKIKSEVEAVDDEMIRWEKKNGFSQFDRSMHDRRERFNESKLPGSTQFGNYLSGLRSGECLPCSYAVNGAKKFNDDVISEFAAKGYVTAIKFKKAVNHFKTGTMYLNLFGRDCWSVIVHELAQSFRVTEKILEWDYQTLLKANDVIKWAKLSAAERQNGELDKDIRICEVLFNANKVDWVISTLKESIGLYPNDLWFKKTLCSFLGFVYAHEQGAKMAAKCLRKYPDNIDFLYLRSAHLRNLARRDEKAVIEAHEKFLAIAPPDDPRVPEVYYSLAYDYVRSSGGLENQKRVAKASTLELVAKYYKLGLEAEKHQIPCFLPITCDQKTFLDEMMAVKPFETAVNRLHPPETLKSDAKKATKRKPAKAKAVRKDDAEIIRKELVVKLTNPQREGVIREHRQMIFNMRSQFGLKPNTFLYTTKLTFQTKLKQEGPPQLAEVKSITFQEMDPLKEHVYEGFVLKCDVIDEPTLGFSGVGIVVEDENGDVDRACVYNISQDEGIHGKIGYGCKITILNPYFRIAMDGKSVIRVDDVASVIFESGPDASRCRYCGKAGAVLKCGKCKKACYCSKECQTGDWKILRHKFVCEGL